MESLTMQLVAMWIRDSKPVPVTQIPHDCIMEAYGVECHTCEDLLEWNACVKEEWIDDFCSFLATTSRVSDSSWLKMTQDDSSVTKARGA